MTTTMLTGSDQFRRLLLGKDVILGQELARGGEGKIHAIEGHPQHVAKILFKPSAEKTAKLAAMLANPPDDETRRPLGHISIAWPIALIMKDASECVGFVMPYIDPSNSFPLLKVYNPHDRRETHRNFTWEYLLRMALNLARIIEALHKKGYIVGDLNESNILVTTSALVTLVDCDSIQVPRRPGKKPTYFRCTVGKPEYTPPELQGVDFSSVDRKQYHDNFSLAVLIFLMLMEGRHPFAGAWRGNGPPRTLAQNIQAGDFPYANSRRSRLAPPKNALPFDTLPPPIQGLMWKCFVTNLRPWWPQRWPRRPTASNWVKALEKAGRQKQLIHCDRNYQHVFSGHLDECPWCARMALGIPDPFPSRQNAPSAQLPGQPAGRSSRQPTPPVLHTRQLPPPGQPAPGQPTRGPRHTTRSFRQRALRGAFLLLSILLYPIEIYLYFYALVPLKPSAAIEVPIFLILLIIPLFVYITLMVKYRSY